MRNYREVSRVLVVFLSLAGSSVLAAQEETTPPEESTGPKISIHGYLTQAYAQSNGHQFLGINKDGTADYRTAALQIRADVTANDAFVVQLSHERFGASPLQNLKDDVELDWVFYQHRFGDTSLKVGRVQIPFGIYNEVRDVGTLLPFYRPSHNFYGEAAYSSETLDGVVLSHRFSLGESWGLDADLHYGNWKFAESNFQGGFVEDNVDDSLGAELWLETPVSGLRIGAGAMRYDINSVFVGQALWKTYHVSLAGDFARFAVNAEYKNVDIGPGNVEMIYLQLGAKLTQELTLNAQDERFYFDFSGFPRAKLDDDRALGLNYAFQPTLILKAEHHWNQGGFYLENLPPPPQGVAPSLVDTRYWILSLSTSF